MLDLRCEIARVAAECHPIEANGNCWFGIQVVQFGRLTDLCERTELHLYLARCWLLPLRSREKTFALTSRSTRKRPQYRNSIATASRRSKDITSKRQSAF